MKKYRIDLRSDTKSLPSRAMRAAMLSAAVGDEQSGEDPSVNELCRRVAATLGKQDAIFLPSGTMCNQIAFLVHCRPGDEVVAAEQAHAVTSESGGAAALAGVQFRTISCERGIFDAGHLADAVRPWKHNAPRPSLVLVEQTSNHGGGAVWPLQTIEQLRPVADRHGLILHMDGARLFNACAASGISPAEFSAPCDSVWIDLSKGLGCPVGAVLAGSREFIQAAWAWKRRLGGAMRQAGILAAAGVYALDHHIGRLSKDHRNATKLADGLSRLGWIRLHSPKIETNLVFFDVSASGYGAEGIAERLAINGVGIGCVGPALMRAVTHIDISEESIDEVLEQMKRIPIQ